MVRASLSKAWDDTRATLSRDSRLLVSVALALLVLPGIVSDLVRAATGGQMAPQSSGAAIVVLVALLLTVAGQLALMSLVLHRGSSVGSAIGLGFRRLPSLLAAWLLWAWPFLLIGSFLLRAGNDPTKIPPTVALLSLIAFPLFIFLGVRMAMVQPAAAGEGGGPIHLVKRSWSMTRGNWFRLFAFALLYGLSLLVVVAAATAVSSVIAQLALGGVKGFSVGVLLVSTLSQSASAAVTLIFVVMLARLYAQLSGEAGGEVSVPHTR
ncbi:hypothetical protein G7077_01195 [Sphingomonas piscis]|uniref:Glycerophosphoryl diester phosphodiesterase membrane domain-containing protein n=1 Tax=Sphingomonas piscis TaxID=2714943 RepID=A0A6G7YLW4_9SPHN|nr:glycerophosphoryl diester phosphodiesterase membrane domain-containing protein [Sphingomonas piscis]QIK77733.1 hypothetical protein G7077_01195 [Sphingomonas piscis]